jgi:hypothetical protein
MLKLHEELAEVISKAEKLARRLYDKGCQMDATVRQLREAGAVVQDRIRAYKSQAAKEGAALKEAGKLAA